MSKHYVLSLFTGAGGLDLGLEAGGFDPILCVEIDPDSRETLRRNRPGWHLSMPGDIHEIEEGKILQTTSLRRRELALLAGGPPCQPFSKSAYWVNGDGGRLKDPRAHTLRAYLRIVEEALPQVILLENVKGLTYSGKDEAITLLRHGINAINKRNRTRYELQTIQINTADYGVPQARERVFLIAAIDGKNFEMPRATHGRLGLPRYRTAWDAIGDLDNEKWPVELNPTGRWADLLPTIPEGSNYLWHTPRNQENGGMPLFGWRTKFWSFLLKLSKRQPAWTIQAEPGPATGPFHWRSRLLSIQELCRLQTISDEFQIYGDRRSAHRQVGNAVPSAIGELLGLEIRHQFFEERCHRALTLIPPERQNCPPPERLLRVPPKYFELRRKYRDHPGPGLGPGARRREREGQITS